MIFSFPPLQSLTTLFFLLPAGAGLGLLQGIAFLLTLAGILFPAVFHRGLEFGYGDCHVFKRFINRL
jgi:hypothetical protein